MAYEQLVPGVVKTIMSGNVGNTTAGTAYGIPYMKQGVKAIFKIAFTGTVTAVSIAVQISIDNTDWSTIYTSTSTTGELIQIDALVAKWVRLYHTSRTGGTAVTGSAFIQ